jgi:hypothetical protein
MAFRNSFVCLGVNVTLAISLAACAPSPQQKNHDMTARIIQNAHAEHAFVDASTTELAAVRHTPSGMVCVLPARGAFNLEAFPQNAANEGGDCTISADSVATTLLAVRFATPPSLDDAFSDSVRSNASHLGGAIEWMGRQSATDALPPNGLPHFRIVRLQGDSEGQPTYLRIAMAEKGGWFVQQMVFAPLANANKAEAKAGEQWRAMISNLAPASGAGS